MLLASVELDQQPISGLPYPEEGCVQTVEDVDVLGDGQYGVWHSQEGVQLPDECPGTLALPQEILKSLPPYAPVLAYLQARQLPFLAPLVDRSLLDPHHLGDFSGRQKLRLSRPAFAVFHALLVPPTSDALVTLVCGAPSTIPILRFMIILHFVFMYLTFLYFTLLCCP